METTITSVDVAWRRCSFFSAKREQRQSGKSSTHYERGMHSVRPHHVKLIQMRQRAKEGCVCVCLAKWGMKENGSTYSQQCALRYLFLFHSLDMDIVKTNGKYLRKIIHLFGGIVCVYFYLTFHRIYSSIKQHKQTILNAGIKLKLFTKQSHHIALFFDSHSFAILVLCNDSFQKIFPS